MKLNTPTAIILVVVLLGLSGAVIFWGRSPSGGAGRNLAYFYDLSTGELFVDEAKLAPPIPAPSGPLPDGSPAGVRAYVFSCGDCDDPEERFIGYLGTDNGLKVREVDGERWASVLSAKADTIREQALKPRPGKGKPKRCYPTRR